MTQDQFSCLVITGASSGIGRALAERFAAPGRVIGLAGRNIQRLTVVAEACRSKGAVVVSEAFDIEKRETVDAFVQKVEEVRPINLAVANAGSINVIPPTEIFDRAEDAATVVGSNLTGLFHTVAAALEVMRPRGFGQIALISSMSAITPLPHVPAYSATKAAVKALGEAIRVRAADHGIAISIVFPGYVDTPMARRFDSAKPFQMSADDAAERILAGLERRRAYIGFPAKLYLPAILLSRSPRQFRDFVMKRMRGVPEICIGVDDLLQK